MISLLQRLKDRLNRKEIYSTANFWNQKALAYNDNSVSMWPNNNLNFFYHKEQSDLIEKYIFNINEKKILDVGCGTGRMARFFSSRGALVDAFDFSEKSIEIAKNDNVKNINFKVMSVFDLDETEKYEIIFSWGVLVIACRNRAELKDALLRLYKSLKADGKILLLEPIHENFLHRVLEMSLEEFTEVLREVGFNVQEIEQLHFWPVRILLSYWTVPMFITKPMFIIGQHFMKYSKNTGDYKLIFAQK